MKKETKQDKVAKRKVGFPAWPYWGFYYLIMGKIFFKKYHGHITIEDDINDCKGPCFLIWNHLARQDHTFLLKAAWPKRFNIMAGYNEFFRSHLHFALDKAKIIPKKNYTNDIPAVKNVQRIINKGGCVAFAPEGMSSIYGTNQPVCPGTGRFLKHFKIPVYFLELRGTYLTSNKICLDERYGENFGTLKLFFKPEDLEKLSPEEIEDKLNLAFKHDEYEWNKEHHIKFDSKGRICTRLHDICYKCPKCGTEFEMSGHDDVIECKHCGNGAHMDDYYEFHKFNDDCVIPESPSKWVAQERIDVIKEIRANPNYSFKEKCKVGDIPETHWIKNKQTSEICGEGEITIDHSGIHFKGTKRGAEFNFDLTYQVIFSLVIVTCPDHFALYINGKFHEFFPERDSTGKMLLLVEEMHRLHVNEWKNFPWNDYMYIE